MVCAAQPLAHAAGAGVVGSGGEHAVAVELAVNLAQVSSAELDVFIRVQHLGRGGQGDAELACSFLGGAGHQLHQAAGADAGAGIVHERAFLTGDGKDPAGVQATYLGFAHQGVAVGHREADVQIVPVLRLADGADGRKVPLHVVGQFGLGDHLVTVEMTADVVPLTATVDDLATGVEFQGTPHPRGIAHLVDQRLAHHQRLVVQLVRRFGAVSGEETVEVPLLGHVFVQHQSLRVFRLGQLQAACLPVAPTVGGGQVLWEFAGQLVGVFPARQAQQQAQTPL